MIDLEQAVRDTIYNPDGDVLMADFLEPLVARAFRTCMDCGVVVESSSTMREHVLTGCQSTATTRLTAPSLGGISCGMEQPSKLRRSCDFEEVAQPETRPLDEIEPLLIVTIDKTFGYKLTVTPRDRFDRSYTIVCKAIGDLRREIEHVLNQEEQAR